MAVKLTQRQRKALDAQHRMLIQASTTLRAFRDRPDLADSLDEVAGEVLFELNPALPQAIRHPGPHADYPDWDARQAETLLSSETHIVDYSFEAGDDGVVVLVRNVWTRNYRGKDRKLVYVADAAHFSTEQVPDFVKFLVTAAMHTTTAN